MEMTSWRVFIATSIWALILSIAVAFVGSCKAHEAPSGMQYDSFCCHDMDCAPAIESHQDGMNLVITTPQGTMVVRPDDTNVKWLPSMDGRLHGCQMPYTHIPLCVYIPEGT
jgi:hypothetical protein